MSSLTFSFYEFFLFLSNCFFIASFTTFIATFQLFYSLSRKSFSFGNSVFTVKFPFYRYLPKLSLNKVYPVAVYFLSLYWNSTTDNHSIQLSFW